MIGLGLHHLRAALSLAFLLTYPSQSAFSQQQGGLGQSTYQIEWPIIPSVENADDNADLNRPCKEGQDNRRSDLCAQWKSADSAHQSVLWAARSFILGLIGLAIAILTFIAAFAAALYAKNAAAEAKRSADVAEKGIQYADNSANAAMIAARAAQGALTAERAWVVFDGFHIENHGRLHIDGENKGDAFAFAAIWNNSGRSPALRSGISCDYRFIAVDAEPPEFPAPSFAKHFKGEILGPGRTNMASPVFVYGKKLELFLQQKIMVVIFSRMTYHDIFSPDEVRITEACYSVEYRGRELKPDGTTGPTFVTRGFGPQNTAN